MVESARVRELPPQRVAIWRCTQVILVLIGLLLLYLPAQISTERNNLNTDLCLFLKNNFSSPPKKKSEIGVILIFNFCG